MKIYIDENEMKKAIVAYVADQGINIEGKNTEVDLVAGRKENGFSATIDITNGDASIDIQVKPEEVKEDIAEPKDSKKLKFGNA